MQTVGLVSWEVGTGQNTVAVNLAIGLAQQDKRVIVLNLNSNPRIYEWLQESSSEECFSFNQTYSSGFGVDFIYPDAIKDLELEKLNYDYAIINIGGDEKDFCKQGLAFCDFIIACTRLQSPDECSRLLELQSKIKEYGPNDQGFNLILPLQVHSGEWKTNSQRLFELAEAFGEEKLADFLPHCERIHDLFIQKKSVWMLSQPAIVDAFNRLLKRIEQLHQKHI
ncbi:MAG: hypothetical protein ABFD08_06110 [Syntrophomonas sp.]